MRYSLSVDFLIHILNWDIRTLKLLRILLVLIAPSVLWAISLDHSAYPSVTSSEPWPQDTPIRLCAIRVEFQADTVTGTTGTGHMGNGFPDTLIIDPLPHDRQYFADHLQFLSNYYGTVSKGAIAFSALDIYPESDDEVYRLEYPMWHYNYNTDDDLLDQRLVELFAETVQLASEDINYNEYDVVLIFHAGVGKDFNIGYDETPFDIPSAFISEEDLQGYTGALPGGITNGIILPESQNQQEILEYDIQLSMNGVLVKLFGNWLGMPDLFNTEDGSTGIGRWGMMDQGSGNVNALVPSLPDIWSRIYMGWQTAKSVVPPGISDTIHVARFNVEGAPEAIKIPVTPREYYLIENRDADADSVKKVTLYDRDGRQLRINLEGDIEVQEDFKVAVSANHYDFGIPGSGILIWHIDENVINENLDDNRVNADPSHRGVDLVEADGSQDIGQEYAFATAGSGTELGVQEDCWYRTNREHRDANGGVSTVRFNERSRPEAKLYDRSFTNLELANFSDVDSIMSFTVRQTNTYDGFPIVLTTNPIPDQQWSEIFGRSLPDYAAADLDGDSINELCVITVDSLKIFDSTASLLWSTELGSLMAFADIGHQVDVDGDGRVELLLEGTRVGIVEFENDQYQIRENRLDGGVDNVLKMRPAVSINNEPRLLVVPQYHSSYVLLDLELNTVEDFPLNPGAYNPFQTVLNLETYPSSTFALIAHSDEISVISVNDTTVIELWSYLFRSEFSYVKVLNEPERKSIYVDNHGYYNASSGELNCYAGDCEAPTVDWDGDGVPGGGGLNGSNSLSQEDEPQLDVDVKQIVDLDANGDPDIIGLSNTSDENRYTRIKAVEHGGPSYSGFPIASPGTENREFFEWGSTDFLHYVSITEAGTASYLSIHRLPITAANRERFPYTEPDAIINVGPLRPQVHNRDDFVYCWPNPTSDVSHIRFSASSAATAKIQIFDLAGRRVTSLNGSSDGAGQFEVDWNVAGIQSGVYIARAELTAGGQTQNTELKIAVVK